MASKYIKDLVKDMEQSNLIIPSFQRDYVWKREQIEALFDSFMRRLPISSLLFWKLNSDTFSDIKFNFYKFFSNYNSERKDNELANPHNGTYYAVIDGQQRLTSIFIGFFGSYTIKRPYARKTPNGINTIEYKLYLRLTRPLPSALSAPEDNAYGFKFLSEEDIKRFDQSEKNMTFPDVVNMTKEGQSTKWVKVSKVPSLSDFQSGEDFMIENGLNSEEQMILRQLINLFHETGQIECIEWSGKVEEAIAVFVRYNSKGTVLSPGQIMMSMMTEHWPEVRTKFKDLQRHIKEIGFERVSVEYLVKALLTVYKSSPKNDIRVITQATTEEFKKKWGAFSDNLIEMFAMLRNEGFTNRTLTSYNATIPILYYLIHKKKAYRLDNETRSISSWLLRVLLTGAFGGQSDSAIESAVRPLKSKVEASQSIDGFPSDEIFEGLREHMKDIDVKDFLNIQKDSKEAPLLMSMLYPDQWNLGAELDHIHPIKEFDKNGNKDLYELANSIVNLQLLPGELNANKSGKTFKTWLETVLPDEEKRKEYLKSIDILDPSANLDFKDKETLWENRKIKLEERLLKIFKR